MSVNAGPLDQVRAAVERSGRAAEIRVFAEHMPTVEAAARVLGVEPRTIAKSILLLSSQLPVLVVAAGDRRVDRQKVKELLGLTRVRIASADEVLAVTGFVAGGVAPVGLISEVPVLLDASLQRFSHVWAGGGVPEALMRLAVADLPLATGGRFADVCESP